MFLGLLWCNVGFAKCIEGNCKDGQGTLILFDGSKYEYCDQMYEKQELFYSVAKNANNVLEIGSKIKVKILKNDEELTRLSLGIKQLSEDPWKHVKDHIEIDKNLIRPAEVDVLLADYSKAKKILKWEPKISFDDLVIKIVENDLKILKNS